MKVYYSLYDRLLSAESLQRAFRKVKSNGGKPGIDGQTVEAFAQDLPGQIVMLVSELRDKSYQPLPVKRVVIPKDGGGIRELGIPPVRDVSSSRRSWRSCSQSLTRRSIRQVTVIALGAVPTKR